MGGGTIESAKIKDDPFWENWRKPWPNTIFYAPLTENNKDVISWNAPYSTRWSFSYDWISCGFSGASMYWNLKTNTTPFTQPRTIFEILKPTSRRVYSARLWYPMRDNSSTGWFEIWLTRSWDWWSNWKFWLTEWSGSRNQNNWREMPLNQRHIFVTVYTWSKLYVYRDWTVYDYSPVIWVSSWWGFNPTWNMAVMRMSVNNQYDYYDWYVAHLGVENRAWSEKDVQKFVKTFRDVYL